LLISEANAETGFRLRAEKLPIYAEYDTENLSLIVACNGTKP